MNKQKLPKTITSNGKTIKIKYVKNIPEEAETTLGVFDSTDRVIYIKSTQNKNELIYTLLHEIHHVLMWSYGLHNIIEPKIEEVACDTFANSFVMLVKKNPELIKIIKEMDDHG